MVFLEAYRLVYGVVPIRISVKASLSVFPFNYKTFLLVSKTQHKGLLYVIV